MHPIRRRFLVRSTTSAVLAALAGLVACTDAPPTAARHADPRAVSAGLLAPGESGGAGGRASARWPRPNLAVTTTPDPNGNLESTFDFEEAPNGGELAELYAAYGLHFENASAYHSGNSYYPPKSPPTIITATIPPTYEGGNGVVTVTFDSSVTAFGAYVTSFLPLTLTCFDAQGAVVGTQAAQTPNLDDGRSPYAPNQLIKVTGDGIARCTFDGANNYYTLDNFIVTRGPAGPKLSVRCSPASPIRRGEYVDCLTTIQPHMPYTIIERRAEAEGHVFVDSTPVVVTDRGNFEDDWIGEAIVPTRVTITANVTLHGKTTAVTSAPDSFTVKSRMGTEDWTRLTLSPTAPTPQIDPGNMLKTYPPFQKDMTTGFYVGASGGLGTTPFEIRYSVVKVRQGPNTNWLYERVPVTLDTVRIYYSRAIDPSSAFYKQQDGTDVVDGKKRYHGCGSADMNSLLTQVFTHERGHYAVGVNYYSTHDVQAAFEGLHYYLAAHTTPGDTVELAAINDATRSVYFAGFDAAQAPLDQKGTPYPISLHCVFHGPFPQ